MIKKITFYVCLCLSSSLVKAQFNARLVVVNVATKTQEDIYVAGNFNNWNPKDENYKLKPYAGGRKAIVLKDIPSGNYAFKFTRGSWDKVECEADGRDINDRILSVDADAILQCNIKGWKDDYPDKPKPYTASPQVKIIDTAFKIPQLNRSRRIWVYLPKGYASSNTTYPVLYMHDGQNLFNEQTAPFGEWGVDECLDSLQKKTKNQWIVVGIDNGGGNRMNEYSPYNFDVNKQTITAEGNQYINFIVNTLKPYIDAKYRTKKGAQTTGIAGSSLGGLISYYATVKYPNVFGSAGIFSPSFWVNDKQVEEDAAALNNKEMVRFYLYGGGEENKSLVTAIDRVANILEKKQNIRVTKIINPKGKHNENTWRQEFDDFYLWLAN
jgi:metallo-beta-lactamase class B